MGQLTDQTLYVFRCEQLEEAIEIANDLLLNDISIINKLKAVTQLIELKKITGTFRTGDSITIDEVDYTIRFLDWNYMFFNPEHLPAILVELRPSPEPQ